MRKGRFWYFVISFMIGIFGFVFTFIKPTVYNIYIYIVIALLWVPNFTLRNSERNQLIRIIGNYTNNCDSKAYYDEIQAFYKTLYLTKRAKKLNNIILAMIKCDMGEIDEAEELLKSVCDIIEKTNKFNKYNYYRAWCNIYYERGEANHYQVLLEEMRKIIDSEKRSVLKSQMSMNFHYIEAKYFILNGIYLDKARSLYEDTLNGEAANIMRLSSNYYLGVIASKENNREKAIEYFKKVAFSGRNLNMVTKATKYVEALEK